MSEPERTEPERTELPRAELSRAELPRADERFEPKLSLSNAAFRRGLWGAAGALSALTIALSVREVTSVLVLVLVAGFIAVGMNPVVELVARKTTLSRLKSVALVSTTMLCSLSFIVIVVISALQDQVSSFIQDTPDLLNKLLQNRAIRDLNHKYHFVTALQDKLKDPELGNRLLKDLFSSGSTAAQGVASTIVVVILSQYFLTAMPQIKEGLYSLAPASRRSRVAQLGDEILRRTGRYVVGAFLVALLAGVVTAAFLLVAGLGEFALPLALLVALLDLVPLAGSLVGATIVILLCFATSPNVGLAAAIFYLVYELLEGYVIYPRVMRASVDMPEYATIIAVLLGGALGGIVGALVALPTAAAIMLLIQDIWVRRQDAN